MAGPQRADGVLQRTVGTGGEGIAMMVRSTLSLLLAPEMEEIAARFHARADFLYLGRGINYPIALEGAL